MPLYVARYYDPAMIEQISRTGGDVGLPQSPSAMPIGSRSDFQSHARNQNKVAKSDAGGLVTRAGVKVYYGNVVD